MIERYPHISHQQHYLHPSQRPWCGSLPPPDPSVRTQESDLPDEEQLVQHTIKVTHADKFLLCYALLKLRLLRGKTIIFVNDVDRYTATP